MNETLAQEFISKYRNYGEKETRSINTYFNSLQKYKEECRAKGTSVTLGKFEKIYSENTFDIKTKLKNPLEDEIKQVLNDYTQEILV